MASLQLCALLCGLLVALLPARPVQSAAVASASAGRQTATATLVQLQAVCRHGGRAPRGAYPTDPYRNLTWQGGFGGLVASGVSDQVRLGAFIRSRYGAALGLQSCQGVNVISSERSRTVESARALLHGLFQDTPLGGVEYQGGYLPPGAPVCPIIVIPEKDDYILRLISEKRCPRLLGAIEAMLKRTPEYQTLLPLLKLQVAKYTGIPNVRSVELVDLFDTLRTQQLAGLTIPEWTQLPLGPNLPTIYTVMERFFFLAFGAQGAPTTRTLSAGGLLRTMLNTARRPDTQFQLFAAHDTTLAALEASLGVYAGPLPTSSCLLLEVFATYSGERFVRLLQRSGSSAQLRELPLGYTSPVPLTQLEQLPWLPQTVGDVKQGCQI